MYLKLITPFFPLFATLVVSKIPTSLNPSQSNALFSAEIAALTSVTNNPEFTSMALAFETAAPQSDITAALTGGVLAVESLLDYGSSTPAWLSSLPSDAQSYFFSIVTLERSVLSTFYVGLMTPTAISSFSTTQNTATPYSTAVSTSTSTSQPSKNAAPAAAGMMAAGVGVIGVAAVLV